MTLFAVLPPNRTQTMILNQQWRQIGAVRLCGSAGQTLVACLIYWFGWLWLSIGLPGGGARAI